MWSCGHCLSLGVRGEGGRLVSLQHVLQQLSISGPPRDFLLSLAVKSGFVAIDSGHNELLSFGLVDER
jgi:hypothetical protein